jgi:hypothetical protein
MNSTAVSEALQQAVRPAGIDASQCLKDFADYLTRVQGLAPRTRQSYCFWVSRFLAAASHSPPRIQLLSYYRGDRCRARLGRNRGHSRPCTRHGGCPYTDKGPFGGVNGANLMACSSTRAK